MVEKLTENEIKIIKYTFYFLRIIGAIGGAIGSVTSVLFIIETLLTIRNDIIFETIGKVTIEIIGFTISYTIFYILYMQRRIKYEKKT